MPAYAIGRLTMRAPSWTAEYGPKTAALVAKHGGKYLVRGGAMERLAGGGDRPSAVVVVEFPTMEQARAWYNDPDCAPMSQLRQSGSDLDLVLVDGLEGAQAFLSRADGWRGSG